MATRAAAVVGAAGARKAGGLNAKAIAQSLSAQGQGQVFLPPTSVARVTIYLRPNLPGHAKTLVKEALPRLSYSNPSLPVQVQYLPRRRRSQAGKLVTANEVGCGSEVAPVDLDVGQGIEVEYANTPSRRVVIGKKTVSQIMQELRDITR
ncbi:hypothetical protein K437DRAFT_268564 [Tilletiaria anomala UBC 951]|uniref:Ribosomal protein/NADH dehydrogenase domain-containing protein n=1 Tax=Tilletiaria anomala (strain ATCC 24038 / CBS 436.72 / UBC 951) TaxID=1037660 RepID=A0A066VTP7_TILAU|nr:uncharacterized protein K437DRAFT_268564 [Tilletiaria anomala UBC 951]KDN45107.1 hypothetical protein K437DRAFT_268564 [Tilletiaria anomala UBC 951]